MLLANELALGGRSSSRLAPKPLPMSKDSAAPPTDAPADQGTPAAPSKGKKEPSAWKDSELAAKASIRDYVQGHTRSFGEAAGEGGEEELRLVHPTTTADDLLLCASCDAEICLTCADLKAVPKDAFFCSACSAKAAADRKKGAAKTAAERKASAKKGGAKKGGVKKAGAKKGKGS